ncbi:hypothetical protein F5Y19DRAFT_477017 [Xylariaceae sp. FL1651]|nr:hypothetical protein F5Y19DRAFT_477017 [Xylariaceae sp. FL1651]
MSKTLLPDISDRASQIGVMNSPIEYQRSLKRAKETTAHRRLCVTKGGKISVVPKRAQIGDSVAVFEGSNIHFILRRVKHPSEETFVEESGKYRLVGPAYFHMPEGSGMSSATAAAASQTFMIV